MAFKLRSGNSPMFKKIGSSPAHTHTTGVPHSESGYGLTGKQKKMKAYEGAKYYTHPTKDAADKGFKTMQVSTGTGESDADRYVIQFKPGEGNKAYEEFKQKNPNIKLDERESEISKGANTVVDAISKSFFQKKHTDRDKLNKLVEKRSKLKEKKEKREEKGKKTKRVDKRLKKVQEKINKNETAQKDKKRGEARDEASRARTIRQEEERRRREEDREGRDGRTRMFWGK